MMLVRAHNRTSSSEVSTTPIANALRNWQSQGTRQPVSIGVNIDLQQIVHIEEGVLGGLRRDPRALEDGSPEPDKLRSIS